VNESSHDLVAARAARVRELLALVGAGEDEPAEPKDSPDAPKRGVWSAWNS
jgi:hypothetical protein